VSTVIPCTERRQVERRATDQRRLVAERHGPTATLTLLARILERERARHREPLTGDSFLKPGWES
jgi:hypothetical protein